ncbi:uncharacterized protein LOC100186427 isoform X2 [Ciona intestinalis]
MTMFSKVTAILNPDMVNKIKEYGEVDQELNYLQFETKIQVSKDSDGITFAGSWFQVQAAQELLRLRVAKLAGSPTTSTPKKKSDEEQTSSSIPGASFMGGQAENNLNSPKREDSENDGSSDNNESFMDATASNRTPQPEKRMVEIHSFLVDRDIYEYLMIVASQFVTDIWGADIIPAIDMKEDSVSIALMAEVTTGKDGEVQALKSKCEAMEKEIYKLAGDVEADADQDTMTLDDSVESKRVEDTIIQMRKTFPSSHCRKMEDAGGNKVIFISPKKKQNKEAKDFFAKSVNKSTVAKPVTVDRDIFEYIQEFFPERFKELKQKYAAEWELEINGDEVTVKAQQKTENKPDKEFSAGGANFNKEVTNLIEKIQQEAGYHHCGVSLEDLPNKPNEASIAKAIASVGSNFRGVFVRRSCDDPNQIIFISHKKESGQIVMDWFKKCLKRADDEWEVINGGGGDAKPASNTSQDDMAVDVDIYQFMEMTMSYKLENIWRRHGVKLTMKVTGDSAVLTLTAPKSNTDDVKAAVSEFQTMYQRTMDRVGQESLDLKQCGNPSEAAIKDTLRAIKLETNEVYISRSTDMPNLIIFISENRASLNHFKTVFENVLTSKAQQFPRK